MFDFSLDEDEKEKLSYNLTYDNYSINRDDQDNDINELNFFDSMNFTHMQNQDNEEINIKEQKSNNNTLNEIKNLENKDYENRSTTKNTNIKIKLKQPFNEPENKFLCNKRLNPSFDNSNGNNNENSLNKKEANKTIFKIGKLKEKKDLKNDSSLVPDIKSFHTLFNTYFKYLVEKGNSFNVSIFNERVGSNGYYINKDFTQLNLGAEIHSSKLKKKIANFIQKNKLEKLKKKNNKDILKLLDCTARELIDKFCKYILENSIYFKENEIIKKLNDNFIRIRKYPFIDFESNISDEKYKCGYFIYYA